MSDAGKRVTVIDTRRDVESGNIVHCCDPTGIAVGDVVEAHIDWDRRYRHMRVHTCLHLPCSMVPFPVNGGSIGDGRGRLDFDMAETVDKEDLESRLNALIAVDHAVSYRWITDAEMVQNMDLVRTMSVRPPMGAGRVRLVDIDWVDLQPCGGTHLTRTGEIGQVTIGKVEKKGKQNRRINVVLAG
ncbi:alanyl-tRNA editing protein [Sedimenticola sp.]|uniref:alanyl-tRNA editing protein n=1 Tax=Sedimenticola sp. TaxID=1940285 RepID=UPI003D111579